MAARGFADVNVINYCSGAYAAWNAAIPETQIAKLLAANLPYLSRQQAISEDDLDLESGTSLFGRPSGGFAKLLPPRYVDAVRRLDRSTQRFVPRNFRV